MTVQIKKLISTTFALSASCVGLLVFGQDDSALQKAGGLMREYRFSEAAEVCNTALQTATDSLEKVRIEDCLNLARNGESMLDFCSTPRVIAKRRLPLREFFLYYPVPDGSWISTPNVFTLSDGFPFATYAPKGSSEVFFVKPDEDGTLNICQTQSTDSLWTAPELLDESLTSSSDDAFPMLSEDGLSLFFSSKGLYGVGGYDLYVSRRENLESPWGTPENMGFPYSSPYNDYLFMNSADGRFSLFASDRECPGTDDVYVYVLEYDSMPVRKSISNSDELSKLCRLDLPAVSDQVQTPQHPEETRTYVMQLRKIQELKSRIATRRTKLEESRARLSSLSSQEAKTLSEWIVSEEDAVQADQDALKSATGELQAIEMDLLAQGITIDPKTVVQITSEANRDAEFVFSRRNFGTDPEISFREAEQKFDYSFKILPIGRFAEDNTLPDGLVYQIQIFSRVSSPAKESDLKGLSPVFFRKDRSGKTIYYAGMFRTYNDVLSNLNKVKRAGFKTAFIVAFNDGKSVTTASARQMEKKIDTSCQIVIRPEGGKLSESELAAVKRVTSKDLARELQDGETVYVLGPYADDLEAVSVISALKDSGLTAVELRKL